MITNWTELYQIKMAKAKEAADVLKGIPSYTEKLEQFYQFYLARAKSLVFSRTSGPTLSMPTAHSIDNELADWMIAVNKEAKLQMPEYSFKNVSILRPGVLESIGMSHYKLVPHTIKNK